MSSEPSSLIEARSHQPSLIPSLAPTTTSAPSKELSLLPSREGTGNIFGRPQNETATNTTTVAGSTTDNSTTANTTPPLGNVTTPFHQIIAINLQGMTRLLHSKLIAAFDKSAQLFLDENQQDKTATINFLGQQLLVPRDRRGRQRSLEQPPTSKGDSRNSSSSVSNLEVRALIKSWKDETPGVTTMKLIQRNGGTDFVAALQLHNQVDFVEVKGVEVALISTPDAVSPGPAVATSNNAQDSDGQRMDDSKQLYIALGLLGIAVLAAVVFTVLLRTRIKTIGPYNGRGAPPPRDDFEEFIASNTRNIY
jgi:hypothetical protein